MIFLLGHYASKDDANQGDLAGNTPLHIAAFFGNTSVAKTLLDFAGANVNARNKSGTTPLDKFEARKRGVGQNMQEFHLVDDLERRTWNRRNDEIERLLKSYGAVGGAQLVWMSRTLGVELPIGLAKALHRRLKLDSNKLLNIE